MVNSPPEWLTACCSKAPSDCPVHTWFGTPLRRSNSRCTLGLHCGGGAGRRIVVSGEGCRPTRCARFAASRMRPWTTCHCNAALLRRFGLASLRVWIFPPSCLGTMPPSMSGGTALLGNSFAPIARKLTPSSCSPFDTFG
jgi:hypothetical protein